MKKIKNKIRKTINFLKNYKIYKKNKKNQDKYIY